MIKEEHYIVATNLAKLRIAEQVLRSLLPEPPIVAEEYKKMIIKIGEWINKLERKV
jgi:hypothetical protein